MTGTRFRRARRSVAAAVTVMLAAAGVATVTGSPPATATTLGSLPSADPTLAFDAAASRWLSLSGGQALTDPGAAACNAGDATWTKPGTTRFAYVPYRAGPAPESLPSCWAGDAFPDGPGAWAGTGVGAVGTPTLAKLPASWLLLYSATRSGSTQRCLGSATGASATGPTWNRPAAALWCPPDGSSASHPEVYFDRVVRQWFVLWSEQAASGCTSSLVIQRLDVAASPVALTGTARRLLAGTHASVRFDETAAGGCPGSVRHRIESPTMIRAESHADRLGPGSDDQLWLLFSAGDPATGNYGTGWALCGSAGPATGGECIPINQLDPATAHRPMWGSSSRTAPPGNVAAPLSSFPDHFGFGGLSLAVPDPGAPTGPASAAPPLGRAGPQPAYAVAQRRSAATGGSSSQVVYRVDTTRQGPELFEPEAVTWHGRADTFGPLAPDGGRTPSGHGVATRSAAGMSWPGGRSGVFNALAADGTLFVAGDNQDGGFTVPTADDMVLGAYSPRTSAWSNLNVRTCAADAGRTRCEAGGATTMPRAPGRSTPAGTAVADVEAIDGGRAIAFTAVNGYPPAYDFLPATNGVWPTFGIASQVNGQWTVAGGSWGANQWTGGQLARTNAALGPQACPTEPKYPSAGESICQGANELASLPGSRDIIVAQYLGTGDRGALMALHYEGPFEGGRYDVSIKGYYKFPVVPDHRTSDPNDHISTAAKEIYVDPTGTPGDERFSVAFDLYPAPETTGVVMEFTYDSATGSIMPTTAPIVSGDRETAAPGAPLSGLGTAHYDKDGNLWAAGRQLVMYAKGTGSRSCGFDPAKPLGDYVTVDGSRRLWGQVCRPDYEFEQAERLLDVIDWPYQITHDPFSRTVVFLAMVEPRALAIRYTGTGRSMSFAVSAPVDTGVGLLPGGGIDQRPPLVDRTGRMWWARKNVPATPGPGTTAPHWIAALDINQLFAPPPTRAPKAGEAAVAVGAETTAFTGVRTSTGAGGTTVVESPTYSILPATCFCPSPTDGMELAVPASPLGPATYRVWVPAQGTATSPYRLRWRVRSAAAATIRVAVDGGTAQPADVPAGDTYVEVDSPALNLAPGMHTLTVTSTGTQPVVLDRFTIRRV